MSRLQRTPSPKATTSGRNQPPADANSIRRLFRFKICPHAVLSLSLSKCRFAKYFKAENGTEFRRLHKAYAIRFDVMVTGNVSCEKLLRQIRVDAFKSFFLEEGGGGGEEEGGRFTVALLSESLKGLIVVDNSF